MRFTSVGSPRSFILFVLATFSIQELAKAFVPKPVVSLHANQGRSNPVVVYVETKKTEGLTESSRLEDLSQGEDPTPPNRNDDDDKPLIPENSLVIAVAVMGTLAVGIHASDYAAFFDSLSQMKANVADPADFWPAVNFWIFFAVAHAILQPIFWISEVLHASPGPLIGGLVPVTFLLGNAVAIAAFTFSKEVRFVCSVY